MSNDVNWGLLKIGHCAIYILSWLSKLKNKNVRFSVGSQCKEQKGMQVCAWVSGKETVPSEVFKENKARKYFG